MVPTRRKRTASKISAEIEPILPSPQPKSKQQKKTTTPTAPSRTSSRRAAQPQPQPDPEPEEEAPEPEPTSPNDLKLRLRNNWKFAATWQFFFNFSEAFKLKEMPIETFEDELSGVFACDTVRKCIAAVLSFLTSGKVV